MSTNGRINIMSPPNQLSLYDTPPEMSTSYSDALNGGWEISPLSKSFFSKENIDIIQNGIRAGVYQMSNQQFVIGNQSYDELKIIMRAVFLQNSVNLATNLNQQIHELNQAVLQYCVPRVFGEAKGYMKYLHDVSTLPVPMSTPMSTNKEKVLELKRFM
jgi:hypothetical protein